MPAFGISRIREALCHCCSTLKPVLFTRRGNHEKEPDGAKCDIEGNQGDKRTFYAWQRNHMANERTFLAWCRTGISLIVFSFVIERFDLLIRELQVFSNRPDLQRNLRSTHHMGLVVFVLGAIIIFLAGWRFFYIRGHINRGESDFSALPDLFLLGSVLVTVLITFLFFVFLF